MAGTNNKGNTSNEKEEKRLVEIKEHLNAIKKHEYDQDPTDVLVRFMMPIADKFLPDNNTKQQIEDKEEKLKSKVKQILAKEDNYFLDSNFIKKDGLLLLHSFYVLFNDDLLLGKGDKSSKTLVKSASKKIEEIFEKLPKLNLDKDELIKISQFLFVKYKIKGEDSLEGLTKVLNEPRVNLKLAARLLKNKYEDGNLSTKKNIIPLLQKNKTMSPVNLKNTETEPLTGIEIIQKMQARMFEKVDERILSEKDIKLKIRQDGILAIRLTKNHDGIYNYTVDTVSKKIILPIFDKTKDIYKQTDFQGRKEALNFIMGKYDANNFIDKDKNDKNLDLRRQSLVRRAKAKIIHELSVSLFNDYQKVVDNCNDLDILSRAEKALKSIYDKLSQLSAQKNFLNPQGVKDMFKDTGISPNSSRLEQILRNGNAKQIEDFVLGLMHPVSNQINILQQSLSSNDFIINDQEQLRQHHQQQQQHQQLSLYSDTINGLNNRQPYSAGYQNEGYDPTSAKGHDPLSSSSFGSTLTNVSESDDENSLPNNQSQNLLSKPPVCPSFNKIFLTQQQLDQNFQDNNYYDNLTPNSLYQQDPYRLQMHNNTAQLQLNKQSVFFEEPQSLNFPRNNNQIPCVTTGSLPNFTKQNQFNGFKGGVDDNKLLDVIKVKRNSLYSLKSEYDDNQSTRSSISTTSSASSISNNSVKF